MILSDREIQAALRDRILLIDPPPDERLYTSTALDLTLDSVLLRWHEPGNHPSGQPIKLYNPEDADHPGLPIQLEIFNVGNQIVVLDVGMPICQLILEEVREVPVRGYLGRFSAQQSFGSSQG